MDVWSFPTLFAPAVSPLGSHSFPRCWTTAVCVGRVKWDISKKDVGMGQPIHSISSVRVVSLDSA